MLYSCDKSVTLILPLILISINAFGLDPCARFSVIINDGSKTLKLRSTFCGPICFKSSALNVDTDPVNVSILRVYIPVITVSSNSVTSSSNFTSITLLSPTTTRLLFIPMNEYNNARFLESLHSIEYAPSTRVVVPNLVPSIITVTPGNGCPVSSNTRPDTFRDFTCCCCAPTFSSRFNTIVLSSTDHTKFVPAKHFVNTTLNLSFVNRNVKFFTAATCSSWYKKVYPVDFSKIEIISVNFAFCTSKETFSS